MYVLHSSIADKLYLQCTYSNFFKTIHLWVGQKCSTAKLAMWSVDQPGPFNRTTRTGTHTKTQTSTYTLTIICKFSLYVCVGCTPWEIFLCLTCVCACVSMCACGSVNQFVYDELDYNKVQILKHPGPWGSPSFFLRSLSFLISLTSL